MTARGTVRDRSGTPVWCSVLALGWVRGRGCIEIRAIDDGDLADALGAAIDGDQAGFARLWRALHPPLLRYLWVVVRDAAEDVASETWLQVARDLPRFEGGPAAFRVWLFRVARNRGVDEQRRAGRRREEPRDLTTGGEIGPTVRDVADEVIEKSATDWALGLIAELPPDQAEAVMLRVVAGLDVASAALVLGKRGGAVRVATMRGLRRLAADPRVRARGTTPPPLPAQPAAPLDTTQREGV
jgi:RNA polymerase sigma-70 factor (ECF subfamily)